MEKRFKTINKQAEAQIVEKKSKFIASVSPVNSEIQAKEFITKIKKKYFDARHNCFAYIIDAPVPIERFNDDGEPSGTAGKPILEIISNYNVRNVVIVVTRYFGGILLGTGGLVKAYGKSAKEGLLKGEIVEMLPYFKINITTDYQLSGKVQYEINLKNHFIKDIIYTDLVKFILYVEDIKADEFIKNIINLTNSKANIEKSELEFIKTINGNLQI